MSVEIEPTELAFTRPFTTEVSQSLKIRNTNRTPVAFKVKTTAPKQYCVRPNSGRIEPGKEVEVTVLLQAMKQDPPLDIKCRDKFLVQSVAVTADKEFTNIQSIWQHVDEAERSSVQEKKIRVVYLAPGSAAAAVTPMKNGVNGASNHSVDTPDTAPPAYSNQRSPSPEATYTPETRRSTIGTKPDTDTQSAKSSGSNLASSIPAAVSNAAPMSYEEMKAKLADAQATISSYAQEGGLRMRKVAKGETNNETVNNMAHQVQSNQGVPLQIVAALCLFSFLLAYLFF
ncbi:PapD-like protein [Rhexocercosporidium sp. MPI-PUGE-AT-0058]|nr:PapD-like protein [Rhexocercosporidium sp. MPI-PUGE-AT-0058]